MLSYVFSTTVICTPDINSPYLMNKQSKINLIHQNEKLNKNETFWESQLLVKNRVIGHTITIEFALAGKNMQIELQIQRTDNQAVFISVSSSFFVRPSATSNVSISAGR